MKRSFRVATVFTGAAACAVGTTVLAPAAGAATTAHNCSTSRLWSGVMLKYSTYQYHTQDACASGLANGNGVYIGTGKRFYDYCAADISGYFVISGTARHFTQGYHHLYNQQVSYISISKINLQISPCRSSLL